MTDNFKVAIIEKNILQFNTKEEIDNLTKESLKEILLKHVTFETITNKTMMDLVVDKIKLVPKLNGTTSPCYENSKHIYQLCYLEGSCNKFVDSEENINAICSFLTLENRNVYNTGVLICSRIQDNGTCTNESLDIDMVTELFYNKLFKKAVKIKTDGTMEEITFLNVPFENENIKYEPKEFVILKFNLIAFIQEKLEEKVLNNRATKLVDDKSIYGDVIICCKETPEYYFNLDKMTIKKMLAIIEESKENRKCTEEENSIEKINNLYVVKNKSILLEKRYNNLFN